MGKLCVHIKFLVATSKLSGEESLSVPDFRGEVNDMSGASTQKKAHHRLKNSQETESSYHIGNDCNSYKQDIPSHCRLPRILIPRVASLRDTDSSHACLDDLTLVLLLSSQLAKRPRERMSFFSIRASQLLNWKEA
jgi:hypothetical protein